MPRQTAVCGQFTGRRRLFKPFLVPVGSRDLRFGSRDSKYPGINIPSIYHGKHNASVCQSCREPASHAAAAKQHHQQGIGSAWGQPG